MRASDFTSSAPGRLRKTVGGAVAFVPEPLPTGLHLEIQTVRLLAAAENSLGRLAGTTAREFNPYLIGSPLLHREAILSSRMEGTITTPEQLVLLEAESATPGRKLRADEDTREVRNYISAMHHGLDLLKTLPVSLRLIREVHRILMQGVRGGRQQPGQFRRSQNWIRGRIDDTIDNARFVPPPVAEMKEALDSFEKYLHRERSPDADPLLVQLALIHYQFETIHPFRDGNGRIGRLILPLLLVERGRLDAPVLYLSAYFERHRELYVDLLLNLNQTGNWNSWVDFFLRGVQESADEANRQAIGLLELRQRYHRQFQKGRSSALLIRLIDRLFQIPSITMGQAAQVLSVSHQAAANNIRKLEEAGMLQEITGRKRNQIFIANEILAFMHDPSHPDETQE